MLTHLAIRNFALIESMDLELERGFVAVTGETGAGKSIVFDAVALLIGGRARADVIRSGEDSCSVQGAFAIDGGAADEVAEALEAAGIPAGDTLIVRRTVSRTGSNKVYVNDTLATVGLLQRVLAPLVEVVGQHEHLTLAKPDSHRALIDRFGALDDLVQAHHAAYDALAAARARLRTLETAQSERAERIGYLQFQRDELEELNLRDGEMAELEEALTRARNFEKLRGAVRSVLSDLNEGKGAAVERLASAGDALGRVASADAELGALGERVEELSALVSDVVDEVRRYARGLEGADANLDALESRHETLRRALRKFAVDEEGAIEKLAGIRAELRDLENYEEALDGARGAVETAEAAARKTADKLDAARRVAADALFGDIQGILAELGMPHAELVLAEPEERALSRVGWDGLEILFSANPGEPPGPIGRIASGGELSRLMLAVKTAASASDRLQTYSFDEVDTGIGGGTAEVVGRLLARLAGGERGRQVLCVTHHAQIACYADVHLRAEKAVSGGRTASSMRPLSTGEREQEIARMIGGIEISDATLTHARTMLASARPG